MGRTGGGGGEIKGCFCSAGLCWICGGLKRRSSHPNLDWGCLMFIVTTMNVLSSLVGIESNTSSNMTV